MPSQPANHNPDTGYCHTHHTNRNGDSHTYGNRHRHANRDTHRHALSHRVRHPAPDCNAYRARRCALDIQSPGDGDADCRDS